jgi:two-component system, NtrC family, sensor kinase
LQSINPSLDIHRIPQIKDIPIFWLRLNLLVDSSVLDQPIGMTLSQVGASEIYLQGRLIYKFGQIDSNIGRTRSQYLLNSPFGIKLGSKRYQTIAVRYEYYPKSFLVKYGEDNYCFHIELNNVGATFAKSQSQTRSNYIRELSMAALRMMLGFLCFGLYFSFRSQKAYLYIGIRNFLLVFGGLLVGLIARELANTTFVCMALLAAMAINEVSTFFTLNGIYLLYDRKKNWFYPALIGFALITLMSFIVFYEWGGIFYGVYYLLYSFEVARLNFLAVRKRRPGAIILLISSIFFFIFIGCTFVAAYLYSLHAAYIFVFLAVIFDPFAWSLFMAGEYARSGIALQARVREVEDLSKQTILQEKEKQQLLTDQNETLELKVSERTSQLNESLITLKATQAQLIQSEKMASLGELTAGIAHEIQNPLNFVNNFSEINTELIDETETAINDDKPTEAKELLSNLRSNQLKINHHGKRADAIVKGMLQHSRASTGQKESIDLNRLVDEYLRISYQGLRTKDNSFNSKMKTNFDPLITRINIIPQDIGRVLLNLYNNAFYAVKEKTSQQSEGYEPTVTVITVKTDDGVEIRVKDNGNGIPKKILDKIFQPFFTTKPTGQGTGLGLSLSYDIIKAHGGEIRVDSKEGEYSEFTIILHLTSTNHP